MSGFDLLGNMLDPWGIFHKKVKKETTAYMKRYYKSIDDYRRAYADIVSRKLKTPTEIKKLGLYDEEALDRGVSMMGGGFSNGLPDLGTVLESIGGIAGEIPSVIGEGAPTTFVPTQSPNVYVPSLARIEQIEAEVAQLRAILDGTGNREDRTNFLRETRRRILQLEKEKLAIKLTIARGEPIETARDYLVLSKDELLKRISESSQSEQKGEPDEFKDIRESLNPAESSDALSDVQSKMRQSELAQLQKIKKKGSEPPPTSAVQWSSLVELITTSITPSDRNTHMGSLLMFAGLRQAQRAKALKLALARIGNLRNGPQDMLDLLSAFGIDLRPPRPMTANESRDYVVNLLPQFNKLNAQEKRRLLITFNKLFRNDCL